MSDKAVYVRKIVYAHFNTRFVRMQHLYIIPWALNPLNCAARKTPSNDF